ncbi:MAG: hypothetical protein COT90_04535 [Candidatus Diapherotrites archaeon CG10_big_fil_rev_8_21_14_0_10_31_34]|nr:MAG: hypothetical protein COT90_04535 [Candidatus Diapherotrites archaeon CG10_big_fil_rev_8_21_14_0_10_31_34]
MKKILIGLILFLLFFGCTETKDLNSTDINNSNDLNNSDFNSTDLNNSDINFDKTPKERMIEKLEENYYDTFVNDAEFLDENYSFFECTTEKIFIGKGVIWPASTWNIETISYNFIDCPKFDSINELREKQLKEAIEERTTEKEFFEGKEIRIEKKEEEIETEQGIYLGKFEYRYYACEGIILEGIYLNYGTGPWNPKKYWFKKLFNDMISQCKT